MEENLLGDFFWWGDLANFWVVRRIFLPPSPSRESPGDINALQEYENTLICRISITAIIFSDKLLVATWGNIPVFQKSWR